MGCYHPSRYFLAAKHTLGYLRDLNTRSPEKTAFSPAEDQRRAALPVRCCTAAGLCWEGMRVGDSGPGDARGAGGAAGAAAQCRRPGHACSRAPTSVLEHLLGAKRQGCLPKPGTVPGLEINVGRNIYVNCLCLHLQVNPCQKSFPCTHPCIPPLPGRGEPPAARIPNVVLERIRNIAL